MHRDDITTEQYYSPSGDCFVNRVWLSLFNPPCMSGDVLYNRELGDRERLSDGKIPIIDADNGKGNKRILALLSVHYYFRGFMQYWMFSQMAHHTREMGVKEKVIL